MDTDGQIASTSDSKKDEHSVKEEDCFPGSCIHISNYKREFVLDDYRHLYSFFVARITQDSFKIKKGDCVCRVQSCETKRTRIHACLYCTYFGCFDFKDVKVSHINLHAQINNHPLGMDIDSGCVFCFKCNDYKYDFEFGKISQELNVISYQRGITTYKWEPNFNEINLLKWHKIVYDSKSGIRGLINIQTTICYMNTVIQSLIYAPAFRDYLLSFKHKCKVEEITDYPSCFICEMSKIVQECFSGESKPYLMTDFLILIKDRLEVFAKKEHFDASEFFELLLPKLCEDCEESSEKPCNCIIHTIFELSFQTKYTCHKCQKKTVSDETSKLFILLFSLGVPVSSVTDCFKRMLLENVECSFCRAQKSSESEFVLKKTPIVLTFILNVDTQVPRGPEFEFKEFLNIFPENVKDGKKWWEICKNPEYQYYLFSVIEHLPSHYKAYIKKDENKWFCCSHEEVKEVRLETILKKRMPKMLFYHRQFL